MRGLHDWSDIEAELRFLSTEEGGRNGYADSGYQPQFYHQGQDWISVVVSAEHVRMYPGSEHKVSISFLSPHLIVDCLAVGDEFALREGNKVVARGIVLKIVDLKQSAEREIVNSQPI
ncbi:MAG: elongation factor Tu [Pseudomonadota bacterium]